MITSGSLTMSGVIAWPRTMPIGLDMPRRMVATVRSESLNQCWLILVGTQEMKGQAMPVSAWPGRAKTKFEREGPIPDNMA